MLFCFCFNCAALNLVAHQRFQKDKGIIDSLATAAKELYAQGKQ